MKYDLIAATDEHMCRQQFHLPGAVHLYPSEASTCWTDAQGIPRVSGCCMRKAYLRLTGEAIGEAYDAYTQWIFSLGKAVEEILVEQWKQMGIWVANNVKFYDPERNISGEVDVILRDPINDEVYCVEVKSFAGYQATRSLIGNSKVSPAPKTSQMLQALIYVDQCKDQIDYVKMVYYARDSGHRTQFDIRLIEDNGVHRPTINDVIDYRFTLEDIYSRYEELNDRVERGIIPEPDFQLVWDDRKVELRNQLGEISKSAYDKWKKNKNKYPVGDWQCRFCSYCNHCWPK